MCLLVRAAAVRDIRAMKRIALLVLALAGCSDDAATPTTPGTSASSSSGTSGAAAVDSCTLSRPSFDGNVSGDVTRSLKEGRISESVASGKLAGRAAGTNPFILSAFDTIDGQSVLWELSLASDEAAPAAGTYALRPKAAFYSTDGGRTSYAGTEGSLVLTAVKECPGKEGQYILDGTFGLKGTTDGTAKSVTVTGSFAGVSVKK